MLRIQNLKASGGFTLIELMIGLVIVAIVLAMGMPSYSTWILNAKLRTAAESIQTGLQLARSEAVSRNAAVSLTMGSGSSWVVGCVVVTATCPTSIQSRATGEGSSSAVTVSPAAAAVTFDNLGRMSSPVPAAGTTFTQINVGLDPAVLAASKVRNLNVTVGVGGNVRLCDPHASSTDPRAC
ncbi:GspH/FimT family pseudopilin [Undibacterium sp. TJN25]|uniref:GspH/FimT family pseudopilin n=1 Tax=Undibacterium sp. TJN25 TaxID=3413056 RepID=UPI003BF1C6E7